MDTLRLHKVRDVRHEDGRDIILRYQTVSGSLYAEVKATDIKFSRSRGARATSWRLVLLGNDMNTRIDVARIPDALALPFVMADLLALLRALPATAAKDRDWAHIKAAVAVLCKAYGLGEFYASDQPATRVITKERLAHRVLNYPRKLTEVVDGIPAA